jgi:hypothetical protein
MNQYNKKHYLLILTGLVVITMLICYTLSGGFFKPTEVFLYSGSPKQISTRITSTSSGASFRSTSSMMERSEWVSAIQFPQASTYSSSSNAMRIYASSSGHVQSFGANPISNSYTMATNTSGHSNPSSSSAVLSLTSTSGSYASPVAAAFSNDAPTTIEGREAVQQIRPKQNAFPSFPDGGEQSNQSPVGEPWVMLLFAAVAAIVMAVRRRKVQKSQA